jgi:hypothetical protein
VAVSAIGGSSKSDPILLVLVESPTRSPGSYRVVCAHLALFSSSATASGCFDSESKSSESYESKISFEEELTCVCSSSQIGGRMKVSACDFSGACETHSLNWTLQSMMSRSKERSIRLYPFTPSGF